MHVSQGNLLENSMRVLLIRVARYVCMSKYVQYVRTVSTYMGTENYAYLKAERKHYQAGTKPIESPFLPGPAAWASMQSRVPLAACMVVNGAEWS
eukprot:363655-Chlamydomonas_euryale.AAC.6